jgi:hypothetical protein
MYGDSNWSLQLTLAGVCAGVADHPLFVNSNPSVPIKNIWGRSAVAFCACRITQLRAAVFCVVTPVHKFGFRFALK